MTRKFAARGRPRKSDADIRADQIKLIHVGFKQLEKAGQMTQDGYQAMLQSIANVSSSADMTNDQRAQVLAHLRRTGFTPTKPASAGQKPDRKQADSPQASKLRALWLEMHDYGFVRNPAEAALAAYCKRQTRVEALQWLDNEQLEKCIEALKKWRHRDEKALCKATRKEVPELEALALALYGDKRLTADTLGNLTKYFSGEEKK